MLALERKATVGNNGSVNVRAQPFGGAVRILNPRPLQKILGEIQFDSVRSKHEQDFRILILPSQWEPVKAYCLQHLQNPDDAELESLPDRELVEEFEETIKVHLRPEQYTYRPEGFVIEDSPVPTDNTDARGRLTVRLYRIFEVRIVDLALCNVMLAASERCSDQEVGILALKDFQKGGMGRGNSILTLPLRTVTESYLMLPLETRYRKIVIENHEFDESVLAVLEGVEVQQYRRI
jgi:hypothetical protein